MYKNTQKKPSRFSLIIINDMIDLQPGCISRPNRREWIETSLLGRISALAKCISRPNRREWIETRDQSHHKRGPAASPGLTAGSGLKRYPHVGQVNPCIASPGLTAGSGLKP